MYHYMLQRYVAVTKSGTTYTFYVNGEFHETVYGKYVNGEFHETETGTDSAGQTDQLASMSIGKGVSGMRGVAIHQQHFPEPRGPVRVQATRGQRVPPGFDSQAPVAHAVPVTVPHDVKVAPQPRSMM